MSDTRHPSLFSEGICREDSLRREPWLDRARQQSQRLASLREGGIVPLDWSRLDAQRPVAQGLWKQPRLAWGTAFLVVVLLCGATGTWAFYVQPRRSPAVKATVPVQRPKATPSTSAAHKRPHPTRWAPAARPGQTLTPSAHALKHPRARKPGAAAARESASPALQAPVESGDIIFGDAEMPGGGEIIIVNPPSRFEPLISPESYRKKGPSGMVW